jgi:tetratricopeptide (TPR) repeat protein
MKNLKPILFVLCLGAAWVTTAAAGDSLEERLRAARDLVDKKAYAQALVIYAGLEPGLRKDAGLMIEWARVYTYADDHPHAIRLFEDVRRAYPERAREISKELAEQYLWSDHLEESYAMYQKVLDQDNGNLEAQIAQAKILVWQGYLRRGIERYEAILKRFPKNPDAIEGMAFAWHWLGDDVTSVKRLDELFQFEPDRREAKKLYGKIKGEQSPFLRSYGRFTSDSTPQTVLTMGERGGSHINYKTYVEGVYEHQILRKKNASRPNISADREGTGITHRFDLAREINFFVYQSHFNKVGFEPVTVSTWYTYKPDDLWRFDAAYERETFEDNDALFHKVITNSGSLSVDLKPDRFWLFGAKYKRSYYSDDNTQDQVMSKVEFRLSQKPYVKLFYNKYYSAWGEPELNHGYFNPVTLRSHVLGLYTGIDVTPRLFLEAKAAGGYEFQRKTDNAHKVSNHPLGYGWLSANYRMTPSWLVTASGDYFTTWPDHGQRSYQKRGAYLAFTYNFGATHDASRNAGRPYRATGAEQ